MVPAQVQPVVYSLAENRRLEKHSGAAGLWSVWGCVHFSASFVQQESLILPPGQPHLPLGIGREVPPAQHPLQVRPALPSLGRLKAVPPVGPWRSSRLLVRRPSPLWLLFHLVLKTTHVMVEKTQAQTNKVTSSQHTGSK